MAAVSSTAVASVTGVELNKAYNNTSSPHLPLPIAILGEANTANQTSLNNNGTQITSAAQAATLYGAGSPIHSMARILFPTSGAAVSVPVYVFAQDEAGSAAAKVMTLTPTGTATAAGTIYLVIGGRYQLDGASYAINIAVGDTPTMVCDKMRTAVAAATNCPGTGTGTSTFIFTTKWAGLTSNDVTMTVDTNNTSTGVTFAVVNTTAGSGTPTVTSALNMFGNNWYPLVINGYGLVTAVMDELEAFNGIPTPNAATGRYAGIIWKPFLALSGTVSDNPTALTSGSTRPNNVTIVSCPAPLSAGMPYEAAANYAYRIANMAQDNPHLDEIDQALPDMPPPPAGSIPAMNDWTTRNSYVMLGCTGVDFVTGQYIIKDLITTYNPTGEYPPFYRYVRDMIVHFNKVFKYRLVEQQFLIGKAIVRNDATVRAANVMKPKMWVGIVANYLKDMESLALVASAAEAIATIEVTINASNPNRFDTTWRDSITGIVRISSTSIASGFNYTT